MTEKLFYEDSHQAVFNAKVIESIPQKTGFLVSLDKTAFFPEGGGQYADRGTLNGVGVSDAQEKDGIIWHYTE